MEVDSIQNVQSHQTSYMKVVLSPSSLFLLPAFLFKDKIIGLRAECLVRSAKKLSVCVCVCVCGNILEKYVQYFSMLVFLLKLRAYHRNEDH